MAFSILNFILTGLILGVFYLTNQTMGRVRVLLYGSLLFYVINEPIFTPVLIAVSLWTYSCGWLIGKTEKYRRHVLVVALIALVAVYYPLKYNQAFDSLLGHTGLFNQLRWLYLPLGLSFYGFKAATYLFDVYYGKSPVIESFEKVMLFIGYFPQIISGPIMGPQEFLSQIESAKSFNDDEALLGLGFISLGVFKKVVFANTLSNCIQGAFLRPKLVSALEWIIIGGLSRLFIYYDFSGYSEVSNGVSLIFGVKVAKNFDQPFKSKNIMEFWRRWHISLSKWLRDYIYFPLVTSFSSYAGIYISLVISFTFLGLWHGDRIHFILYGLLNGLGMAFGTYLSRKRGKPLTGPQTESPLSIILFYICFVFTPCSFLLMHDTATFYDFLASFTNFKTWFQLDYFTGTSDEPSIVKYLLVVPACIAFEMAAAYYGPSIQKQFCSMSKLTRLLCVLLGFFLTFSLITYELDYRFVYQTF